MPRLTLTAALSAMIISTSALTGLLAQTTETNLSLPCGSPTILAGFRFTSYKCNEQGPSTLSIYNTYNSKRNLVLKGNMFIDKGIFYLDRSGGGIVNINFAPLQSLAISVNDYGSLSLTLYSSNADLRFRQLVSLKCNSPTNKQAGLVITSTCTNSSPRFIIENNSAKSQVLGYYGTVGNNIKFKNLYALSQGEQTTLDLSVISRGKNAISQTYKLMVYTKTE